MILILITETISTGKMRVVNNIDVVQIPIKPGTTEYYFPLNHNFRGRVVDKIVVAFAPQGLDIVSPVDRSSHVLRYDEIDNLYMDLYASDDTQIMRDCVTDSFMATNNHPVEVNRELSLSLCRLYCTSDPVNEGVLLLYVYYGSKNVEYYPATKSLTVTVPLDGLESVSLQALVDNYIHMQPKKVKGVYMWKENSAPAYLSLRSEDNRTTLNYIPSVLARPPFSEGTASETQIYPLRLDNIDIDMLNSYLFNPQDVSADIQISFLF